MSARILLFRLGLTSWRSSQKSLGATIWGSASGDGKRASQALEAPIWYSTVHHGKPSGKP
eukprot:4169325-Prymnesium_polylepis.1